MSTLVDNHQSRTTLAEKIHPVSLLLDFIRSMRTSPRISADEAAQWAALEIEFEQRTKSAR
jgi:hypothetical protein